MAIGELADGLDINLNAVHTKYPGLNGYEIALSESQERMAVVIAPKDLVAFIGYCDEEGLEYAQVARVSEEPRMRMFWHGEAIVDLSRALLNSNGATKHATVVLNTHHQETLNRKATPDSIAVWANPYRKTLTRHSGATPCWQSMVANMA